MAAPKDGTSNVIVQLGRYGDLLNIFPLLDEMAREGHRAKVVVAEAFAPLLDGVSYADRLIFHGKVGEIREAAAKARDRFKNVKVSQTWGDDWKAPKHRENFQREAWNRLERDHRFEQCALVIDRRDAAREAELAVRELSSLPKDKPLLLVSLDAVSHPLPNADKVKERIVAELGGEFNIVDISKIAVHRLYDLLGLMDRADCLITVDTATLHLSTASAVPVVALVGTDSWAASLRRPNHIFHAPYNDIDFERLFTAVRKTALRNPRQKIVHVWSEYPVPLADVDRHERARLSWQYEWENFPGWVSCPVTEIDVRNSDKEIGDTRKLPFIKDLIEKGFAQTKVASDIVVLTNSDVGLTAGMTEKLRRLCAVKGACFAYRFDFDGPVNHQLTAVEAASGKFLGGLDLIAVTREFWEKHRNKFPDSILGCSNWDLHYRDVIKQLRGGELYGSHWHELHESVWKSAGPENPGNAHNGRLYAKFRKFFDRTRPYSA